MREEPDDESTGISVEERRQITDQIDRLMADNRIEVSPQNLSYVSRRNGALLPLFSNVVILSAAILRSLSFPASSIARRGRSRHPARRF